MQAQARHNLIRGSLLAAALGCAPHSFGAVQFDRHVQHTNQLESPFGHTNQESGVHRHWDLSPEDNRGWDLHGPPLTSDAAAAPVTPGRVRSQGPIEHGNSPAADPFRGTPAFHSAPTADPGDQTFDRFRHDRGSNGSPLRPGHGSNCGAIPSPGGLPMLLLAALATLRRRRLRPVL